MSAKAEKLLRISGKIGMVRLVSSHASVAFITNKHPHGSIINISLTMNVCSMVNYLNGMRFTLSSHSGEFVFPGFLNSWGRNDGIARIDSTFHPHTLALPAVGIDNRVIS